MILLHKYSLLSKPAYKDAQVVICLSLTRDRLALFKSFAESFVRTFGNEGFDFLPRVAIFYQVEDMSRRVAEDFSEIYAHIPASLSRLVEIDILPVIRNSESKDVVGPKWCVYSAHYLYNAQSFLMLDLDLEFLRNPLEIYGEISGRKLMNPRHAITTPEVLGPEVPAEKANLWDQVFDMNGIYHGHPDDFENFALSKLTDMLDFEAALKTTAPINTGVLALGPRALAGVYNRITEANASLEKPLAQWVEQTVPGQFTGHREQALINLSLVAGQVHTFPHYRTQVTALDSLWNFQTMHHQPDNVDEIRILHYNGLAGKGPSRDYWLKRGNDPAAVNFQKP